MGPTCGPKNQDLCDQDRACAVLLERGAWEKGLEDRFPGASRLCSTPAITSVHPNSYSFGDGEQDKKKKLEEFMKMPIGYSAPDLFVDLARFGMGYGLH